MNKRGLGDVVTTVLIILLSLVAVGIIGGVVVNSVQKSGENVDVRGKCQDLEIKPTKCTYDLSSIEVLVKRGPKGSDINISNISVILEDNNKNVDVYYPFSSAQIPKPLETKQAIIPLTKTPAYTSIAGFVRADGKELGCGASVKIRCNTGSVVIIEENTPPSVVITSPSDGTLYDFVPATVAITATASDSDGIKRVEFYNGNTKLGEDTTEPYSFTWTVSIEGTYLLSAKAVDNKDAISTSQTITITVVN